MRFLVKWEDRCTPSCQTLQPNTFHQSRLRWCEGFPAETEDCRDDRPQYVLERHLGRRRGNGSWPHWHTPPRTQPNYKAIFDAGKGHEYRYASPPARPNHKATLERSQEHHMHNCLHSQITRPAHTISMGEGLDGVKTSILRQHALTTDTIDALQGDAREIAEGTKAAFTGVHKHLHSHGASIKSHLGVYNFRIDDDKKLVPSPNTVKPCVGEVQCGMHQKPHRLRIQLHNVRGHPAPDR
jgi:hypothetical protein